MFRRMALFVLVAGLITALLPRQSRSYQIQTCTYVPPPEPVITGSGGFTALTPPWYGTWYNVYFQFVYDDKDDCRLNDEYVMQQVDQLKGVGSVTFTANPGQMIIDENSPRCAVYDYGFNFDYTAHGVCSCTPHNMNDKAMWGDDAPKDGPTVTVTTP